MNRIALKLAFSGRSAWFVQALTAAAVGVGTALFLFALCVTPAMDRRADRTGWIAVASNANSPLVIQHDTDRPTTYITVNPDYVGDASVQVVSLAAGAPGAPIPPGISRLPGVDEVFVSPAMRDLISRQPVLANRYGTIVGLVDASALTGPDHLLVVRGVSRETAALSSFRVTGFPTDAEVPSLDGILHLLLLLAAVAMLAPIALFVAMATRLTAASRDERLARLRLAGASTRLVRRLVLVESLIPGVVGSLTGLALFWALRPAVARLRYDDVRWFVDDFRPGVTGVLLVALLVPAAAALAAQVTLGAVIRSPVQSSTRGAGRPVRFWRVIPLALAVPALIWVTDTDTSGGRNVMIAFVVLLATLVLAGPWFTRAIGAVLARTGRAAAVMAGRRLTADPRAGFRSIGGVILAVLLSTLFVGSTPAAVASLQSTTVVGRQLGTAQATLPTASSQQSNDLLRDVQQIPGVEATLVYEGLVASAGDTTNVWIGDCEQITEAARLPSIPCDSASVIVADNLRNTVSAGRTLEIYNLSPAHLRPRDAMSAASDVTDTRLRISTTARMPAQEGIDMPGVLISSAAVGHLTKHLRPSLLLLAYKNDAALEQARSVIVRAVPTSTVGTRQSTYDGYNGGVRRFYWLLTAGTTVVFLISATGLVIAMLAGLVERKRPFTMLRATGADIPLLRRTLLLEAMAPLTVMSVLSAVAGAAIGIYISAPEQGSPHIPWAELLLPVATGLSIALLTVALATTMVRHHIDTTRTRFE